MKPSSSTVLGIALDAITTHNTLENIRDFLSGSDQCTIATINAEFIMEAQRNERFRGILNASSLRLADGIGPMWAARYLAIPLKRIGGYSGGRGSLFVYIRALWQMVYSGASLVLWPRYCRSVIPERLCGTDLVVDICRIAEHEHKSIFLLGGKPGVAEIAGKKLVELFPALKLVGVEEGLQELRMTNDELRMNKEENNILLEKINNAHPDIIFVAFGHPKQEMWIGQYLEQLPSVRIAMGVGGAFDFIAGDVRRAPVLLRKLGIEWLWRLIIQPWRFSRIITATFRYIMLVIKSKV